MIITDNNPNTSQNNPNDHAILKESDEEDQIELNGNLNGDFSHNLCLEEDKKKRKERLIVDIDEAKAAAGFQNITNAARFWRASQIMGTRRF